MSKENGAPDDLGIEEAIDRWIRKRQTDATEETVRAYHSRLKQFRKWCDQQHIDSVAELDAWTLDEYQLDLRDEGHAPTTIKSRLSTISLFLEYLEVLDVVDEGVSDAIELPKLSKEEEQRRVRLKASDALAAIELLRDSMEFYGSPIHATLEVLWHVGCRMGALIGLDIEDFDAGEQSLHFRHRPDTGTPLKNKRDGERMVGLSDATTEVLQFYIARERWDRHDDHGRRPLFATDQGRASHTSIRAWSYQASQPCLWRDCPHGKDRRTCEWTARTHASKCPSSRSPHAVRTGSITWQLNQGADPAAVATRVNASIPIIKRHYDQASSEEEFYERRHDAETDLDITNLSGENNNE